MKSGHHPHGMPSTAVSGSSLVEVLIALLVLSLGLLGVAGLQLTGLRNNEGAYLRSQAVLISYDLVDRMRADRERASAYDTGGSFVDINHTAGPDPMDDWIAGQLSALPQGRVNVDCDDAEALCTVQIRWDDQRAEGEADQTFALETRL